MTDEKKLRPEEAQDTCVCGHTRFEHMSHVLGYSTWCSVCRGCERFRAAPPEAKVWTCTKCQETSSMPYRTKCAADYGSGHDWAPTPRTGPPDACPVHGADCLGVAECLEHQRLAKRPDEAKLAWKDPPLNVSEEAFYERQRERIAAERKDSASAQEDAAKGIDDHAIAGMLEYLAPLIASDDEDVQRNVREARNRARWLRERAERGSASVSDTNDPVRVQDRKDAYDSGYCDALNKSVSGEYERGWTDAMRHVAQHGTATASSGAQDVCHCPCGKVQTSCACWQRGVEYGMAYEEPQPLRTAEAQEGSIVRDLSTKLAQANWAVLKLREEADDKSRSDVSSDGSRPGWPMPPNMPRRERADHKTSEEKQSLSDAVSGPGRDAVGSRHSTPGGGSEEPGTIHSDSSHASDEERVAQVLSAPRFHLAMRGTDRQIAVALAALLVDVRRETIEACAKECDAEAERWHEVLNYTSRAGALRCAETVRALLTKGESR